MTIAYLIADASYLIFLFLVLASFLLALDFLVHGIPGPALNPVRRALFQLCFPLLKFSDKYLSFQWGWIRSRGIVTALAILLIGFLGASWMVLLSFSLRG